MVNNNEYDVIIIGGGPAGLSAGIYTARARLNTLLIERGIFGGQILDAELVENYPGFTGGISGVALTQAMYEQATKFGMKTIMADVIGVSPSGEQKVVETSEGNFAARAVIVASGSERQKLGVPGEEKFTGKGVSYCATCDAAFFRDKTVAVAGGGNAAITEALQLSKFAAKVIVIHRRSELRATPILRESAFANSKLEFIWDTVVAEVRGGDFVKSLKLRQVTSGKESTLEVDGIFVAIGFKPSTGFLKEILTLDATGTIVTNDKLETGVAGIFAAGDVRYNSIRQVIAAAGDGAVAAVNAERFLSKTG